MRDVAPPTAAGTAFPAAAGLCRPFAVSGSSPPTPGGPAQLTTSCMLLAGFIVSRSRARGGRLAHGGQAPCHRARLLRVD